MLVDAHLQFSVAQSLAASAVSTNVLDLGGERRIGSGVPMAVVIVVTTVLDGTSGDETYSAQIQSDDNVGFASAASVGGAIALPRSSAAGTKFIAPLPPGVATERFMRLNYTVAGTTPSGAVTAFLTAMDMIQNEAYYADAFNISI